MAKNINKLSEQHKYAKLATSLTSDQAVARGISTRECATLILFFYILAWEDDKLRAWFMPKDKLYESRFLQTVIWLKNECFLNAAKASIIADLLIESGELKDYTTSRSVQTVMARRLPRRIEKMMYRVKELYQQQAAINESIVDNQKKVIISPYLRTIKH